MKRFITIIFGVIAGAVLMAFVLSGCSTGNETAAANKEIITNDFNGYGIYPSIFKDTETGQEYIVFTHNEGITVTPRLPKEK